MADVIDASRRAGDRRFLGAVVRPLQAAGADPREGRERGQGRGALVKINIDENQELAQQLRIQSIPAVYAFFDGRPVDGFVGAVPESQIKEFVERLGGGRRGPCRSRRRSSRPRRRCRTATTAAPAPSIHQVLQHEPDNVEALAGLARATDRARRARRRRARCSSRAAEGASRPRRDRGGARGARACRAGAEGVGQLGELKAKARGRTRTTMRRASTWRRRCSARPARGGDRRAAALVQARPQLERGGGAQAAGQVLRGAGPDRSADPEGAAAAVVDPVLVSGGR